MAKIKYTLSLVLVFLFLYSSTSAQNLVPNGSFEGVKSCPNSWVDAVQKPVAFNWYSPDSGTPDYYNTCGSNAAKAPDVWAGYQQPAEGSGFAGIYNWSKFKYKEYLAVKLVYPLQKDSLYTIGFSFALAKNAEYACFEIGLYLSPDSLLTENKKVVIGSKTDANQWNSVTNWAVFKSSYKATGTEQFLFIGNFQSNQNPDTLKRVNNYVHPMLNGRSYLYIDEVIIEPFYKPFPINKPFSFKHIYFQFDQSVLMETSFMSLDKLATYLKTNQSLNLSIIGYTDDVGDDAYNKKLSQQRAEAVKSYLVAANIELSHIIAVGKGEFDSAEVAEDLRSKNRRVEFVLIPNN